VIDGGTAGYELINFFEGKEKVIIVDAVKTDDTPGSVYKMDLSVVQEDETVQLSLHQIGLKNVFKMASMMDLNPEVTLIGIVPVGHMSRNGDQDWGAMRDQARQQIFRRLSTLGIPDLEKHIKFEINFTPPSWRKRYNLVKGSTHGLCHNLTQLAYFRPDYRHPHINNMYFVGASTRPGTGMPTAMVSGRQSAQRITDDFAESG
jgi:hypothetical protein